MAYAMGESERILGSFIAGKRREDYIIFHRSNSMAAQREVAIMSLHPYSREQVLTQVASPRRKAVSKESENVQRRKQNV